MKTAAGGGYLSPGALLQLQNNGHAVALFALAQEPKENLALELARKDLRHDSFSPIRYCLA